MATTPFDALRSCTTHSVGSEFGRQEILVKLIPFGLCAAATAIPARAGLINVGGEGPVLHGRLRGQRRDPVQRRCRLVCCCRWRSSAGRVGGGAWAGVTALLRIKGNVNEAISLAAAQLRRDPDRQLLRLRALARPGRAGLALHRESSQTPRRCRSSTATGSPPASSSSPSCWSRMFLVLRYTRVGFQTRVVGGNPRRPSAAGIPVGATCSWRWSSAARSPGWPAWPRSRASRAACAPASPCSTATSASWRAGWAATHRWASCWPALLFGAISVGGDSLQIGAVAAGIDREHPHGADPVRRAGQPAQRLEGRRLAMSFVAGRQHRRRPRGLLRDARHLRRDHRRARRHHQPRRRRLHDRRRLRRLHRHGEDGQPVPRHPRGDHRRRRHGFDPRLHGGHARRQPAGQRPGADVPRPRPHGFVGRPYVSSKINGLNDVPIPLLSDLPFFGTVLLRPRRPDLHGVPAGPGDLVVPVPHALGPAAARRRREHGRGVRGRAQPEAYPVHGRDRRRRAWPASVALSCRWLTRRAGSRA